MLRCWEGALRSLPGSTSRQPLWSARSVQRSLVAKHWEAAGRSHGLSVLTHPARMLCAPPGPQVKRRETEQQAEARLRSYAHLAAQEEADQWVPLEYHGEASGREREGNEMKGTGERGAEGVWQPRRRRRCWADCRDTLGGVEQAPAGLQPAARERQGRARLMPAACPACASTADPAGVGPRHACRAGAEHLDSSGGGGGGARGGGHAQPGAVPRCHCAW